MRILIAIFSLAILAAIFAIRYSYQVRNRQIFLMFLVLISGIRLSAFWYLIYSELTGRQSYSLLGLVVLMYPEGFFVPQKHHFDILSGCLFSSALLAGSVAVSGMLTCAVVTFRHFLKEIE